ncbi:MAG: hypothetical protein U0703_22895 [Anaerolineae bacterium]
MPELTEIRVGTYVFNDWTTVTRGWCPLDDCAMTVRATVVSRPTETRAILDSGSKTLSSEVIERLRLHRRISGGAHLQAERGTRLRRCLGVRG